MDFNWEKCIDMSEMFVYITRLGTSLKNPDTWLHHHHDFMSTTTLVTCVQHHLDHEGPELPELSLRHVAQDVALVVNHRSGKKCIFRKKEVYIGDNGGLNYKVKMTLSLNLEIKHLLL